MKRFLAVMVLVVFVFSLSTPVFANEPKDKLSRGLVNTLSAILELPQNIDMEWKASNNAAVGIFTGIFKGMFWGVSRAVSGLWDIITFPFPQPADYNSVIEPEYVQRGVQTHFITAKQK